MLFASKPQTEAAPPPESHPAASPDHMDIEDIRAAIKELSTGTVCVEYLKRKDAIGKILRPVTVALRNKTSMMLETIVNIWVEQTRPLLVIAEMFRDMRELERRSQAMAAASEEMTASISEVARSAETVARDAQNVKQELSESVASMGRAMTSMEGISGAFNALTDKVQTLDKASEQIASILKTIEKIASQTNLLALNATIEAARAGEAGKGFAVVASEVKNLAKQTAGATEDIRQRIAALQEGMSDMLSSMNDGANRVAEGKTVIQSVSDSMHNVGARVDQVTEKMVEVTSTVKEQTSAVNEVSTNIAAIAGMTKEVLQNTEKVTQGIQNASTHVQKGLGEATKTMDADMLVMVTKADHASFKKRVIDTILGGNLVKSSELPDHHNCRLGKWYDTQHNELITSQAAYKKLEEPHKRVHECGKKALEHYEKGDFLSAIRAARDLDLASENVMACLDELHNQLSYKYSHSDE